MKYIERHITVVASIFEQYQGQEPLHLYIKKFFKKNKKFGSRDRRNITDYLYGVYRMGRENRHLSIRDRVYCYLFLKEGTPQELFESHFETLAQAHHLPFEERLDFLIQNVELRETFRTQEEISSSIDPLAYRKSYYKEPLVYIKLRNDCLTKYKDEMLEKGAVAITDHTIAFPAQTKLHTLLEEKDYVVQDLNSQRTANFFPTLEVDAMVWDCCAGSGGKSILLLDVQPQVRLTVTDVRASILRNLMSRFERYDLEVDMLAELNVNKPKELAVLEDRSFDFIICDVPCTGSGTWARNPEQFYFFDKKEVKKFQKRQVDILQNASARLKDSGELLYISCSVFAKENEEVIEIFLQNNLVFSVKEKNYLDGTQQQADSLFVCTLVKGSTD